MITNSVEGILEEVDNLSQFSDEEIAAKIAEELADIKSHKRKKSALVNMFLAGIERGKQAKATE